MIYFIFMFPTGLLFGIFYDNLHKCINDDVPEAFIILFGSIFWPLTLLIGGVILMFVLGMKLKEVKWTKK